MTPTGEVLGCTAKRHGTRLAYDVDGCRCPAARVDHARYERRRVTEQLLGRPRRIDATGTTRRLRALMAIGWDSDTIAGRLGLSDGQAVRRITRARYIFRTTADRIADLYDQLADRTGPSERARRYAATQGWPTPLWWDDDTIDDPDHNPRTQNVDDLCTADMVVVERLIDGIPPLHVTRAERIEAVRLLNSRGWSRSLIAQQLAMSGARVAQILDVLVHTENHTRVTADSQRRVG